MRLTICRGGTRAFALPLVRPLSSAHGQITSRDGYLLSLMDEAGRCGFGEATPLPEFGTEDLATTARALEQTLGRLVDAEPHSLEEALAISSGCCVEAPCALSAVDSALSDLAAQRAGRPLSAWLRDRAGLPGESSRRISVQALVVGDDPEDVAASAQASLDEGFETFKLKLAVRQSQQGLGLDLERLAALREVIGPRHRIRLDANEAWTFREAEIALASLERFEIDYIEQPVGRSDRAALKDLDMNASISVAADEALLGKGWEACLESRAASIFIVKPAALGGIDPALTLFCRARALGIRVIWSSLIDAVVGRTVVIALAAALGHRGEAHGVGTARLLARDLIDGCEVVCGGIELGEATGLGCDLTPVWDLRVGAREEFRGEVWIVEATP